MGDDRNGNVSQLTGTNDVDKDIENESREKDNPHDATFQALRSPSETQAKPLSLHPTRSQMSYGGEDGYSCHRNSINAQEAIQSEADARFMVKFSGDDDPESPRSRSKFRKWVVVLIMAGSALNVYVWQVTAGRLYANMTQNLRLRAVYSDIWPIDSRVPCLKTGGNSGPIDVRRWSWIRSNGTCAQMVALPLRY
jgi:hypothetical protein